MKELKRHPNKALSAARVRALEDPGRYADGNCLYLVVDDNGSKRWVLRVTVQRKRRDVGLGGLSLVSLAEAREEALRLRKIARTGGDPLAERRRDRVVVPTFETAARLVHEEHSKAFRNEKHAGQWIGSLEKFAVPAIGARRVDEVESGDVLGILSPIWLEVPETARRVKQRVKVVMDWAKAKGYRDGSNPTEGLTKVLPKHNNVQEHFAALPYRELPDFITALRESDSGLIVALAFEFLILTASRTSEVLFASWNEVDVDTRTWTRPAEHMKGKREHRVPLAPRCLEILRQAREVSGVAGPIFPGRTPRRPLSNMAFHMCLRRMKRAGITPHAFRSTFRDWAEERTNVIRTVTEAALAHAVKDKTEAAYRRTDLFEKRRKLMETWAAFATSPANAKVVRMGS